MKSFFIEKKGGGLIEKNKNFFTLQSDRIREGVGNIALCNGNYASWVRGLTGDGLFERLLTPNIMYMHQNFALSARYGWYLKLSFSKSVPVGADVAPYNYSVKCFIKV